MKKRAPTHSTKVGREDNANKNNLLHYTQCDQFEQCYIDLEPSQYFITPECEDASNMTAEDWNKWLNEEVFHGR
jgi:hypothetical protein